MPQRLTHEYWTIWKFGWRFCCRLHRRVVSSFSTRCNHNLIVQRPEDVYRKLVKQSCNRCSCSCSCFFSFKKEEKQKKIDDNSWIFYLWRKKIIFFTCEVNCMDDIGSRGTKRFSSTFSIFLLYSLHHFPMDILFNDVVCSYPKLMSIAAFFPLLVDFCPSYRCSCSELWSVS